MKAAFQNRRRQSGMTLIELVVVLCILVALTSLVVGNFTRWLRKAHYATTTVAIGELDRFISYGTCCMQKYPSGWDSLLETGTQGPQLFSKLPGNSSTVPAVGGKIFATALNQDQANALAAIGVTNSYLLTSTNRDQTWSVTTTNLALNVYDPNALFVAEVTPRCIGSLFCNTPTTNDFGPSDFVIFGLGCYTTIIGPEGLILEAPVHAGDSIYEDPIFNYERFAAIFRVDVADPALFPGSKPSDKHYSASFVGFVALKPDGISSVDTELHGYYAAQK